MLFNGFKPLFQALSPGDINQLSYEIVQVFQGEGGTLESLLGHTASVTQTLADRDEVIGDLIDNLNEVLDHVGDRDEQLDRADHHVPHLRRRAQGRPPGDPRLARPDLRRSRSQTADLVKGIRAPFVEDIKQLRRVAGNLDEQQGRARPGAAGAADQAREGRPHRDLRLVVQLLPLRVPGQGHAARAARRVPVELQHRLRQV